MKKSFALVSMVFNLIFIIYACSKSEHTESVNAEVSRSPANSAGINLFRTGSVCITGKPVMARNQVMQLVNNYKHNQLAVIKSQLQLDDAWAANFDLDSLENFICHLKSLVAQSSCEGLTDLGIRFYYGAYSNPAGPGVSPQNARKHTLVMIPTYKDAQGFYIDFDPSRIDPVTCRPMPLRSININTSTIHTESVTDSIFAMNHPGLPPPYTGLSF
jgi:hypothetical protein